MFATGMWKWKLEAVKLLWKQKHFKERSWKQKHFKERSWKRKRTRKHLIFEEPEAETFFIKHGAGMWKRKRWKQLNFCGSGQAKAL